MLPGSAGPLKGLSESVVPDYSLLITMRIGMANILAVR